MEESQFEVFENEKIVRKDLIPIWIKFFSWLFLLFGISAFLGLLSFYFNPIYTIDIFGINQASDNLFLSLISALVLIFNGVVAYLLIAKEDKAVEIAKINALINIVICVVSTILNLYFYKNLTFRIEIFFIWFFYAKMREIQFKWINASKY